MEPSEYEIRIAELEKENRILRKKLFRSEANRAMLEEMVDAHVATLKKRNAELEASQEIIRQSALKYRQLALHDMLTGLPNRTLFYDKMVQGLIHARAFRVGMGLLFLDLDMFKPVNDIWGHDAGDTVLKETAKRLKSCVRSIDTVARIGGDEFIILAGNLRKTNEIKRLANKIVNVMKKPFRVADEACMLGVSIGISLYPDDGRDIDTLLQHADTAMYSVKRTGQSGYKFYQEVRSRA